MSSTTPPPVLSADALWLEETYFHDNDTECSICRSADAPEPDQPEVISIQACKHIFHEYCVTAWLNFQLSDVEHPRDPSCPMCRHVLARNPAAHTQIDREGLDMETWMVEHMARADEQIARLDRVIQRHEEEIAEIAEMRQRVEEMIAELQETTRNAQERG
jgi:hypothetical protein